MTVMYKNKLFNNDICIKFYYIVPLEKPLHSHQGSFVVEYQMYSSKQKIPSLRVGVMDFGMYFAYITWPDARFWGELASILHFLDRSETMENVDDSREKLSRTRLRSRQMHFLALIVDSLGSPTKPSVSAILT